MTALRAFASYRGGISTPAPASRRAPCTHSEQAPIAPLHTQGQSTGYHMELPARSSAIGRLPDSDECRRIFARLLWRAFPASSEAAIAIKAAPILGRSERTIRLWLRCEHEVKLRDFIAVSIVSGVESIATLIEGEPDP